ncbi:Gfo/Idh/MocA family oxidoreductase [Phaeodactylibacter xiamenensis]|uniref:Gfo/Idh/MocA family oxidoreductase n=1 Tax=Phaeodactylibacter xiamenensis TaxID=1524460 RepID=UPI0024A93EC6|nr:Gfo/Idh/MocA family oxidoreductase [Phaeodactylibacter xiamenensis]
MAKKLKLGVIGMSEGNGHPYSWSAIFNGYDRNEMALCPFPVIPEYLNQQRFPAEFLSDIAEVTHVWTQDRQLSESVARAALISNVCDTKEEMIGSIDALLLARDDAENHYDHALPFLEAGIPIYIDKPFALSVKEAEKLWAKCLYPNQIFTCSALQFAKEFNANNLIDLGDIQYIWATIPKSWNKYAVHIIEPTLKLIPNRGTLTGINPMPATNTEVKSVLVSWSSGISAQFQTTGKLPVPLSIRILGTNGFTELKFVDTFNAFKTALETFVRLVRKEENNISKEFTLEMVEILENGKA